MSKKSKNWIAVGLFVLVFGILLLLASLFDFQISQLLTAHALEGHTYITNDDAFAVVMEILGSAPAELMISLAFCIIFWYAQYFWTGAKKYIWASLMLVFNVISNYVLASDIMSYVRQHLFLNPDPDYAGGAWLKIFYVFVGLFLAALEVLAVKNVPKEQIQKLLGFSVAIIVLIAIPNIIINLGIKAYVGRIRYRAMNMYPDNADYGYAAFANWYEVNGQWLDDVQKTKLFGNTDALKSFPSGHTCAAGMSYGLIMLNDALGIKNKKVRTLLWIIPIVITGAVAVSRIIVGAHFMSDVLIGGTMSFLTMLLVREIFVCKGSNVKAMFGKEEKVAA